jgi:hypothetical protein
MVGKTLLNSLVFYLSLGVKVLCENGHKNDFSIDDIHSMLKNTKMFDTIIN